MATYIAREDFLNGIPRDESGKFKDGTGTYFGQLAIDNGALFYYDGNIWVDMSTVISEFRYCTKNEMNDIVNALKIGNWEICEDSKNVNAYKVVRDDVIIPEGERSIHIKDISEYGDFNDEGNMYVIEVVPDGWDNDAFNSNWNS